jgi:hypothetical protein
MIAPGDGMRVVSRVAVVMVWSFSTVGVGCGGSAAQPDAGLSDAPADVGADVGPPAIRHLGIEVNQPAGLDHGAEIDRVKAFGVDSIQLTFPWTAFEPDGDGLDEQVLGFFEGGMTFYRGKGLQVLLSVPIVDTVTTFVPSDLVGRRLDTPAVIARAETMIAAVLARSGSELRYLVLSNEADINLDDGAPTWAELNALTAALAAKVRQVRPDVKTGISITAEALIHTPVNSDAVNAVAGHDVAFVTYYDAGNFGAGSSASIASDLAAIVAATDRPIVLKEFGYATGPAVGGSEAGQAKFVGDAFAAWDAYAARIPLLNFSRMFDGERSACEAQAVEYGLPGDEAFIQFLCTLGLRTFGDAEKPAWTSFRMAAQARTFGR